LPTDGVHGLAEQFLVGDVVPGTGIAASLDDLTSKALNLYFLCDLPVRQAHLDELYAVLRAVKDGELSEDKAITRFERAPRWVWTAIDPESKVCECQHRWPTALW